jgi:DNA-binding NarL/FixJ family response regulator
MKLLIADDHTLFRDALVQYIERAEPSAQVKLAKDLPEAVEILAQDPDQDLVLLDLRMPGMKGLEGFRDVRKKFPKTRLALMSGLAETRDVQAALNMGAAGFFPKTLSGKSLLKAIHLVLAGEKYVPIEHDTNKVMPSYYGDDKAGLNNNYQGLQEIQINLENGYDVSLTPREKDVLQHLLTGASNKEIANHLGLQVVTVKLHVRGICRKLNAKNRTQAVLNAKHMGLAS